jgi:hypothetical protein
VLEVNVATVFKSRVQGAPVEVSVEAPAKMQDSSYVMVFPFTNIVSAQLVSVARMLTAPLLSILTREVVLMLLVPPPTMAVMTALNSQKPAWDVGPCRAPPPPPELPPLQAVTDARTRRRDKYFCIRINL